MEIVDHMMIFIAYIIKRIISWFNDPKIINLPSGEARQFIPSGEVVARLGNFVRKARTSFVLDYV